MVTYSRDSSGLSRRRTGGAGSAYVATLVAVPVAKTPMLPLPLLPTYAVAPDALTTISSGRPAAPKLPRFAAVPALARRIESLPVRAA